MQHLLDWIVDNRSWLFEGAGVAVTVWLFSYLYKTVNRVPRATQVSHVSIDFQHEHCFILFIDDDPDFSMDGILRECGWTHASHITDAKMIDEDIVVSAHIIFVDIQGVGRKLGFPDEGLGLARELKLKYPEKRIIIYSAVPDGDRFHPSLNIVDRTLRKNAGLYEFQKTIEEYARELRYK